MPNTTYRSDHPQQTPIQTGAVHGYVGLTADAPATPLLPAQNTPVWEIAGTGAPVDGVAGTGAGQVPKGSRYTDTTNANVYINGGTVASPVWKLVTRAA